VTLNETKEVFDNIKLKANLVRPKEEDIDTTVTILGNKVSTPIFVAPTAFHGMANVEKELATARAAQVSNKTPLMLSSWATSTVEDVGREAPDCLKMFQVYMSNLPEVN